MDKIVDGINSLRVVDLVTVFNLLVAIAIIMIFFLLRGFTARLLIGIVYKIRGIKDDVKKNVMYNPIKLFMTLTGVYMAIRVFPINSQVRQYADIAFKILIMIMATKFITSLITPNSLLFKTFLNHSKNKRVNNFLCRIIQAVIWITAFFIILYTQKVNLSGLATGLGITSAAIALAAQDVVKNILAGIAILSDKPFEIGDWIVLSNGMEGGVVDITFRSTRIKTRESNIVTIPNQKITSEYVTNETRRKYRRIILKIGLALSTTAEEIRLISRRLKIVIESNDKVLPSSAQINLFDITDCSYEYMIFFDIEPLEYNDYLKLRQEVLCLMIEVIERDHVQLAYPTQTLYLKNGEPSNEDFLPGDDSKDKKLSLKNAIDNISKLRKKENNEKVDT